MADSQKANTNNKDGLGSIAVLLSTQAINYKTMIHQPKDH
jgi:hypothetical protein